MYCSAHAWYLVYRFVKTLQAQATLVPTVLWRVGAKQEVVSSGALFTSGTCLCRLLLCIPLSTWLASRRCTTLVSYSTEIEACTYAHLLQHTLHSWSMQLQPHASPQYRVGTHIRTVHAPTSTHVGMRTSVHSPRPGSETQGEKAVQGIGGEATRQYDTALRAARWEPSTERRQHLSCQLDGEDKQNIYGGTH
jgi:hypothetical protein